MASVHGLQHVENFLAAHLADHDPVGPHPQAVDHQLPRLNCALAIRIGGPGFQPDDVALLQVQFRRVLNCDDAFFEEMKPESTFRNVVFPAPVPPEITMLRRAATAAFNNASIGAVRV